MGAKRVMGLQPLCSRLTMDGDKEMDITAKGRRPNNQQVKKKENETIEIR